MIHLGGAEEQEGFTLVEVMITAAIVAVLGGIAVSMRTSEPWSYRIRDEASASFAQARHQITASTATSADAIAAGLHPDVRGRVVLTTQECTPETKPDGIECPTEGQVYAYYVLKTERLLPGGSFETIATKYIQTGGHPDCQSSPDPGCAQAGAIRVLQRKSFDVTSGLPCSGVESCRALTLSPPSDFAIIDGAAAPLQQLDNNANDVYCYNNGTCDPITYYFAMHDSAPEFHRLAVSTTGSIVWQPSWGN